METGLLTDLIIVFGITIVVLFISQRFRIPTIVGFLLSGMLAGPSILGFVHHTESVELMAEIGIVLLLFTIGIEFSLSNLFLIRKYVILGGSMQVFITLGVTALVTHFFGIAWNQAVFIGFLISLSSTAIVLKLLQQRDEMSSPHGRVTLAILIYQDLIVVPMMLLAPILAGDTGNLGIELLFLVLKGAAIIALTYVSARWIMPRLLFQVVRLRSPELFLLSIIVICFSIAGLTSSLGLSLSLGAFLAGLIISESEYSHQALSIVTPFRDVFTSFFFISIGMLLDINFLIANPLMIIGFALAVMLLKSLISGFSALMLGFPLRTVLLVAISLSQVGEFSFVLADVGLEHKLLNDNYYQAFLAVSILTMAASPFLIPFMSKYTGGGGTFWPRWMREGLLPAEKQLIEFGDETEGLNDHIVIVGFGVSGANVAKAARAAEIPYVIIEINAETVKKQRRKGEHIYYGDALRASILQHVHINKARVVVIAIPDAAATRGIVSTVRELNPAVYIVVRTRYMKEMKPLMAAGADMVVPEEFETSLEIFSIVLTKYLVPRNIIDELINKLRTDNYQMLRSIQKPSASISDLHLYLSNVSVNTFVIKAQSAIAGKTLQDTALRQEYGISLLAIIRGEDAFTNPKGDTILMADDKIVVFGNPDKIRKFSEII